VLTKGLEREVKQYLQKKNLPTDWAVTFPDVYIIDETSAIDKRSDITDLSTVLSRRRRICLNIPIVSANMADVTESVMAISLARLGGCGFIHQFADIEKRVEEVKKVKRADNEIIEKPWTVSKNERLYYALTQMAEKKISGFLVVNDVGRLEGIITSRDVRFWRVKYKKSRGLRVEIKVGDMMTPREKLIVAPKNISIEEAIDILEKYKIEKLPLVDEDDKPVGLITARDILKKLEFPNAARDKKGRLIVGAAVGISKNYLEEAEALISAEADILLVDTARANSLRVKEVITKLRKRFPDQPIIAGNVDNAEGALLLIKAGVDGIKVGIGPGSACKTRIETGVGKPQLSAIAVCAAVAKKYKVSLIADGGISSGGELAKAIVAGADTVMIGGLIAATEETPGEIYYDAGKPYKVYRGSASLDSQLNRFEKGDLERVRAPEGVPRKIPYEGTKVAEVIGGLLENLRSSMSYANAWSIKELQRKRFGLQTYAGYLEGQPKK